MSSRKRMSPSSLVAYEPGAKPIAGWVDAASGLRIEMHHPLESPGRWREYLDGAETRYRAHGVQKVLDVASLKDGRSTSLFFVAINEADRVVAGIRCHGPLRAASEAYALQELDGHPRLPFVRNTLQERVPFGAVEMKGAWSDGPRPGLSNALSRCCVHAMSWFDTRYGICSTSVATAPRWQSTGAQQMAGVQPIAYPDNRYMTILLWWDRRSIERFSDPTQWSRMVNETEELMGNARQEATRARSQYRTAAPARAVSLSSAGLASSWQPEVLDERVAGDRVRLEEFLADPSVTLHDTCDDQLEALRSTRRPVLSAMGDESPRWVFYPWRNCLVRLLGPGAFRALRLDRNRNKITSEEQGRLEQLRIGVVGLSVGHSIAHVLAMEGICGELRLADFDIIELTNLNRIPAPVLDLGLNKAIAVGRRILELDPYLHLKVVPEGISAANVDRFVQGLDVVVEECDSLELKLLLREAARRARIPVLMETSDRGLLDVERFDLEPDRPLFHGLLGDVQASDLVGLSTREKVPFLLRILDPAQLSSRMAASMAEIDETIATWPQLGGDVSLGAATVAAAIRRLGRGEELRSGRVRVDLEADLDSIVEPDAPASRHFASVSTTPPPEDPALAVAHAANIAPSGGNSQPWSLRLEPERLHLLLDRSRTSTMDVAFRGSYVALGAALLNASIAAAAHHILGPVEYFPEGEASDVVAVVNFGRSTDDLLAAQYERVLDRSTNRRAGRPSVLDGDVVEELHRQVAAHGARLRLLTSRDELADYAELLSESDRLRYLSPVLHAEMMSELRWPGQDPLETGIDVRTLELDEADMSKLSVARRSDVMADLAAWDGGRALGEVTRERIQSSSAVAVVTIPEARPLSYVRGGGALQRMWLAAEAAGLAVQPVSPLSVFAVEPDDFAGLVPKPYVVRLQGLAARLRTLTGMSDGETIVLALRLSQCGPPTTRSLRIPLSTVLLNRPAADPAERNAAA